MLWIILGIVVILVVVLYGIFKYYSTETNFWPKRGVKLIRSSEIGSTFERMTLKIPFHELLARIYRKIRSEKLRYGGTEEFHNPVFMPVDVELIKRIMVKDFEYFVNRRAFKSQKKDKILKDMMTIKENQEWKDLRSTMSPTFTTGKIRRMFDIFEQCSTRTNTFLEKKIASSINEIDLNDAFGRYTLDVIAWAAFGVDSKVFEDQNSIFAKMSKRFEAGFQGIKGVLRIILVIFLPKIGALFKVSFIDTLTADFFMDVIHKTIKHRQQTGERRQDFLQLMLDAQAGQLKDEPTDNENIDDQFEKDAELSQENTNKIKITDDILVAQCLLFFLVGFSTTQTLLVFSAFELAVNPDMQEKLAKEIQEATEKTGGKLTYDIVNRLEYLDQIISETLRKYPPGVNTERVVSSDYKVPDSDLILPKDTVVSIPIWAIHQDPEHYPNPDEFDPERFNAENKAKRHPYAYIPFGAGPRNCIAMRFALMEGKTSIAKLVQNFILEPSSKTTIPIKFGKVNLKPDDGMWLSLKPRNSLKASEE